MKSDSTKSALVAVAFVCSLTAVVSACAASRYPSRPALPLNFAGKRPAFAVSGSKLPGEFNAKGKTGSKEKFGGKTMWPEGPFPKGEPVVVYLSDAAVVLAEGKAPGEFELKKPVTVTVGSWLTRWSISCEAEPAVGPGNAVIPPEDIYVLPVKSPENSRKKYSGSPMSLAKPVLIADGGATSRKMVEVNTLHLNVRTDPLKPAGTYRGTVRIHREIPGSLSGKSRRPPKMSPKSKPGGKKEYVGVLSFALTIPEYVNFSMDPEGLQFASLIPGIREAVKPVAFQVESNSDIEVNVTLPELTRQDGEGTIPDSQICIGAGDTPQDALRDAKGKQFGENTVRWKCTPGKHTIYLFSRLNITIRIPAGRYGGVINVDYQTPSGR